MSVVFDPIQSFTSLPKRIDVYKCAAEQNFYKLSKTIAVLIETKQ